MDGIRRLLRFLAGIAESLWLLLLPRDWRRPTRHVESLDHLPMWSAVASLVLLIGGAITFLVGMFHYVVAFSDIASSGFWEKAQEPGSVSDTEHIVFNLSGLIGFVSYLFTPTAWLTLYLIGQGVSRLFSATSDDPPPGDTLTWLVLNGQRWLRLRWRYQRRLRRLGPEQPDRLSWRRYDDELRLVVTSSRDKSWRRVETIDLDDRLWELAETREAMRADRLELVYELRPWPARELVRSRVEYRPGQPVPPPPDGVDAEPRRHAGPPPIQSPPKSPV